VATAGARGLGWIRALTMWVSSEDVFDVPDDHRCERGVRWITEPQPGDIVGIHVAARLMSYVMAC
jgi:hypothetical protein